MALETKIDLNETTIEKLKQLVQANIDSRDGFRTAADEVDNPQLKTLFLEMSENRAALASQLEDYVEVNGTESQTDGSLAAKVHRLWIDLRGSLSGGDSYTILAEAERGEDYIKHAYEDVLKETAGSAMNDVLTAQYAKVKQGHDQIRDLRDSFKS